MTLCLHLTIASILSQNRIVPLVTIDDLATAAPMAQALFAGGIRIVEVALRTKAAIDAIRSIRHTIPDMVVGAGSLRQAADWEQVVDAGAQFAVTPGATPRLLEAAQRWDLPFLPGAATPSEMMLLADAGYPVQKFFPAAEFGGVATLKALAGPLPDIRFCPSGGINASNCRDFLELSNVIAVSGSWLAPAALIAAHDWQQITRLASQARVLEEAARG